MAVNVSPPVIVKVAITWEPPPLAPPKPFALAAAPPMPPAPPLAKTVIDVTPPGAVITSGRPHEEVSETVVTGAALALPGFANTPVAITPRTAVAAKTARRGNTTIDLRLLLTTSLRSNSPPVLARQAHPTETT
jgi:hypothetical protein